MARVDNIRMWTGLLMGQAVRAAEKSVEKDCSECGQPSERGRIKDKGPVVVGKRLFTIQDKINVLYRK